MLQSIDYFTGTIFKCYTHGVGFPICAGGRYDNLVGHFGKKVGAVGAAFGINRLMTAIRSKGVTHEMPSVSVIFAEKNAEGIAYDLAYTLRLNGSRIEGYIADGDYKICDEYCQRIKAGSMMRVHPDGLLQIKDYIRGDITETTAEAFLGFYEGDYEEHEHGDDCTCGHCH